jgi:hypothetical protein
MDEQDRSANTPTPRAYVDEQGWQVREGLTLREAEELLDWLDQVGCPSREVQVGEAGVTVRWHPDPTQSLNLT